VVREKVQIVDPVSGKRVAMSPTISPSKRLRPYPHPAPLPSPNTKTSLGSDHSALYQGMDLLSKFRNRETDEFLYEKNEEAHQGGHPNNLHDQFPDLH